MRLRPAVASDAKALEALENSLFAQENFPLSRHSFYYHIRHNLLFVAETENAEIIGYILALVRRRDAKLYSLGVAPEQRGCGISQLLMQQMLESLREKGFRRVLLEVRCDNSRAIDLYRRFGFSVAKTLKAFYRDGCDAYLMELHCA